MPSLKVLIGRHSEEFRATIQVFSASFLRKKFVRLKCQKRKPEQENRKERPYIRSRYKLELAALLKVPQAILNLKVKVGSARPVGVNIVANTFSCRNKS